MLDILTSYIRYVFKHFPKVISPLISSKTSKWN